MWDSFPEYLRERVREEWQAVVARFPVGAPPQDGRMPEDLLEERAAELDGTEPDVARAVRAFAAEIRRIGQLIERMIPDGR